MKHVISSTKRGKRRWCTTCRDRDVYEESGTEGRNGSFAMIVVQRVTREKLEKMRSEKDVLLSDPVAFSMMRWRKRREIIDKKK